MSLLSIALVGKSNEPLFFYCNEESSESLHLQLISFSALDVIEEKKKRGLAAGNFDMYVGHLFPIEDYRVFGGYSNTHMKLILICTLTATELVGMKETMAALWTAFAQTQQNPFQPLGRPLKSKKLSATVQAIIDRHNSLNSKRRL